MFELEYAKIEVYNFGHLLLEMTMNRSISQNLCKNVNNALTCLVKILIVLPPISSPKLHLSLVLTL